MIQVGLIGPPTGIMFRAAAVSPTITNRHPPAQSHAVNKDRLREIPFYCFAQDVPGPDIGPSSPE